jgi:hypothetical protein
MANRLNIEEMAELDSPLFRQSCHDCNFCDGLRDMPTSEKGETTAESVEVSATGQHIDFYKNIKDLTFCFRTLKVTTLSGPLSASAHSTCDDYRSLDW